MNSIANIPVNEIWRIYDRLHDIGIPETIHITKPDFVLRFWMQRECLVVRDRPGQKPSIGFLSPWPDLPPNHDLNAEDLYD